MKKLFIFSFVFLFCMTNAFAANFVPNKTTISAPGVIQYDFDGKTLEIPVTVTGTPALVTFFVFTKDKAQQVVNMQEGFLGWHYVNKVDTCMYFSTAKPLDVGKGTITWDGKDENGAMIPAGEYTYYIWGFDNANQRVKAMYKKIPGIDTQIIETDSNDQPLNNPIYCGSSGGTWGGDGDTWRWTLGNDPMESTLGETTKITRPTGFGAKQRGLAALVAYHI